MNLTINSTFRPFTYDEMVKPLAQYKEAYDKVEQDYSDLVTQTEMWKDIATQENSPEAYAMYQRYSNELNAIVDDFSKGMNLNNRRALIGMKRRYAQDITPIAQADAAMKEANDFRAKAGSDAIFEVSQYDSLDQFLHGKKANNRYQSREALTKKAAAMTEAAMAEAMKDPEFKEVMGGQYWQIIQHSGGSYDELMEAMKLGMMDNPLAQNRFSQIRQEVARKAGIQNYDRYGQQAIMDAIDLGLYAGLDKPVSQFQANQAFLNPLQAEQLRQMRAASAGAGRRRGGGRHGSYRTTAPGNGNEDIDDGPSYFANDFLIEYDADGKGPAIAFDPNDGNKNYGRRVTKDWLKKYKPNGWAHVVDILDSSNADAYEFYWGVGDGNNNKKGRIRGVLRHSNITPDSSKNKKKRK